MKKGFSLIEVMITIGFIAVLLVPLTRLFIFQNTESYFRQDQVKVFPVMSALQDEISSKCFEDPGLMPKPSASTFGLRDDGEVTEDRGTWDDIDDYAGLVLTRNSATISVGVYYWQNVTNNTNRLMSVSDQPTDFKLVSINARFRDGYSVDLIRILANFYNP
ncbi:MAG: prepilin-type N-terminal cleavage/methylation domain-containing protein [Candidatus Margulisiibacteriota bacterium]|jgi:prepilin-type N-terminal cleavage/methylation domain-containing protein